MTHSERPYWPDALTEEVAKTICCGRAGCRKDSLYQPEHARGICGAGTWRDRAIMVVEIVQAHERAEKRMTDDRAIARGFPVPKQAALKQE